MTGSTARASIVTPERRAEVRGLPVPQLPSDWAWLEVEASGVCGTDVQLFRDGVSEPTILGHHVVGRLSWTGQDAPNLSKVSLGDRVVVEEYLPCGACAACRGHGTYRFCPATDIFSGGRRIGLTPVADEPGLWGGNAELLALPPNAVLHAAPPSLSAEAAVWTLPLANALDWVTGTRPSAESVLVVGPGQHGLAAVAAAARLRPNRVVVAGLPADRARLELAHSLGATDTIELGDDPGDDLSEWTTGFGADLVVHTAGPDLETSLRCVAPEGALVLGGIGAARPLEASSIVRGAVHVRGVRGRHPRFVALALEELAAGSPLVDVPSHFVGLEDVGEVLSGLSDGRPGLSPHVVVRP